MGLFLVEDGRYQGWLAAFLCCFTAVNGDESPIETQKSQGRAAICSEQPKPAMTRSSLNAVWTLNAFKGQPFNVDGSRHVLRVPESAPSISPIDLGDRDLIRTWPTGPDHKRFLSENYGATIFTPNPVRLFEHTEAQKPTLIPLRLGPIVLRDLPSSEHDTPSLATSPQSLTTALSSLPSYSPTSDSDYMEPRDAPLPGAPRRMLPRTSLMQSTPTAISSTPAPSNRSSTASTARLSHQTSRSSIKSCSSTDRPKPKRKRSFPLISRDGNERLDQEILELNTIVEERRAENARENLSAQHVAAVAPAMRIGARSETLNAIGSVFSRPLTTQSSPKPSYSHLKHTPPRQTLRRSASTSSAWARSRVSGWLSTILASPPHSRQPSGEPFYKCQTPIQPHQHTFSTASTSTTSWTGEPDCLSLTEGSSPISKGHSRTLTNDSLYTSSSGTGWDKTMVRGGNIEKGSIAVASTEVGLAF